MTRLYSSFDLGKIVADEDARREQERKDADAAARRAAIDEKRAARAPPAVASGPVVVSGSFSLGKVGAHYLLRNLVVNGEMHDYVWSCSSFSGSHSQEEWLSHPEYRTVDAIEFSLPSSLEWGATIVALHHRTTKDLVQHELAREFKMSLVESLKRYLLTSTRTTYTSNGDDRVEHLRGDACYAYGADVAGKDCRLDPSMSAETKAWFGVGAQEFMDAIKWLTGHDAFVFRVKRQKDLWDVRALMLGVNNNGTFFICATDDIRDSVRPVRGIYVMPKSAPPQHSPPSWMKVRA